MIRYATGDRYEGEFYHGFYYGQGKYIWNDGSFYEVDIKSFSSLSSLSSLSIFSIL